MFDDDSQTIDLFDDNVQVDYRGEEVTVENVLRVLSGRHLKGTPSSKRLDSDENSNVLVYFAGHGGGECILILIEFEKNILTLYMSVI